MEKEGFILPLITVFSQVKSDFGHKNAPEKPVRKSFEKKLHIITFAVDHSVYIY